MKRAMSSTLAAMSPNDELLVGLHNCDDDSEEIANFFLQDHRVRKIQITGGGISKALNVLLAHARNPLVARMDADDFCLSWRFKFQKNQLFKKGVDFLFSTAIVSQKLGALKVLIPKHLTQLRQANIESLLRAMNPLVHPTMLARRDWMLKLGGYMDVPGEDLDLWLRAILAGARFHRTALPVLVYNLSDSQLSKMDWYETGWMTSKDIRNYRVKLHRAKGGSGLGPREVLEIVGPLLPQNIPRLLRFSKNIRSLDVHFP